MMVLNVENFKPDFSVRCNVIYTIASRSYGHSKTEDPQYVKIKGSKGETEEVQCKADFYVYDQDVACTFESDVDIGDYRCLFLRTGGDDALRVKKVGFLVIDLHKLEFMMSDISCIRIF